MPVTMTKSSGWSYRSSIACARSLCRDPSRAGYRCCPCTGALQPLADVGVLYVWILVDVVNALDVERACATFDAVHDAAFFKQKFRKV